MSVSTTVQQAKSRDGTKIAFEPRGHGPALVFVSGAFATRGDGIPLAEALASSFTAVPYDRRGRGDSGDNQPYALEREIEDLEAVIGAVGGEAFVLGHSSGAALALEAAVAGAPISRLALYEPPYIVDDTRPPVPDDYVATLRHLAEEDRRGEAVEYFWREALQMPEQAIEGARSAPMWPGLEAVAHTLWYDGEAMGGHMNGKPLPKAWATQVTIPTLVIDGGLSPASMRNAVAALAELLPNATRRTLEGQGHGAPPEVLGPVLEAFFLGRAG